MCLSNVIETFDGTSEVVKEGWKVFHSVEGTLYFEYFHPRKKADVIKSGSWMNAADVCPASRSISSDNGATYDAGFHVFDKESDAINWRDAGYVDKLNHHVRKVLYKGILARGVQGRSPVFVAKWLLVPEEHDDREPYLESI